MRAEREREVPKLIKNWEEWIVKKILVAVFVSMLMLSNVAAAAHHNYHGKHHRQSSRHHFEHSRRDGHRENLQRHHTPQHYNHRHHAPTMRPPGNSHYDRDKTVHNQNREHQRTDTHRQRTHQNDRDDRDKNEKSRSDFLTAPHVHRQITQTPSLVRSSDMHAALPIRFRQ